MDLCIRRYQEGDSTALLNLLRTHEAWAYCYYPDEQTYMQYEKALRESITYIACIDGVLCGYIRARDDGGFGIYIYDLLVHKDYRGDALGRRLIETVCAACPGSTVDVLSESDGYYIKQGYGKNGSMFSIRG